MPLSPPGCKVLIHEKPSQHKSWDPHRVKGWYLRPVLEHYCCHHCYVINTQAERISDTVEFSPRQAPTPTITSTKAAIIAAEALVRALNNPTVWNNTEALRDTADHMLSKLSKIYEIKTDPAAPRVAETPRVAPVSRVAAEPTASREQGNNQYQHGLVQPPQQQPAYPPNTCFYTNVGQTSAAHPVTGAGMEYQQLISDLVTKEAWQLSAASEFGRLTQGIGGCIKGTNTIQCIPHADLLAGRKPTYLRFVCTIQEQKEEQFRTRMTLGVISLITLVMSALAWQKWKQSNSCSTVLC
jgi:hypothetical protein